MAYSTLPVRSEAQPQHFLDSIAPKLSGRTKLKRNKKVIRAKDFLSLGAMMLPGIGFAALLAWAGHADERFFWLQTVDAYPWQLFAIAVTGVIATIGGLGDWLFHRAYVAVGPEERKSHLLALASGGLPLFVLMICASLSPSPARLIIPIIVVVLYTTVLICFDEFVFHLRRCGWFETVMHRLLVFGNGLAWLAWMHWIYVAGGTHG